ncbi:alkaline phosphatase D family protein [Sphingomonas sp. PAMC 26605]|uniref:alkaline phosphatase D family protein n=1 Tax=Sphingomonas sp. PAMC 26605 TaxID=1112214 RepID=UPI00026CD800|nr:alkaline phosphatase D family protein [Sphingomonas sp. PAMC 26605]
MINPISRRQILGGAVVLGTVAGAPAILRAQQLFFSYPFRLGVASGDPTQDGFVIWTRLAPEPLADHGGMPMVPMPVDWEVASDERFQTIVAKGTAPARPELAHSVHVEVAGLQAARPYWYRFTIGRERSARGRAVTLPPRGGALERARFAVVGCQNYEQGFYTAYGHMAHETIDLVFHYGDYIYEGAGSPVRVGGDGAARPPVRQHEGQLLYSLNDYRRRYAQYKLDPDLQAAHAAAPWFAVFDDHEVENNWVGDIDQNGTPPEIFRLRRAAAFQAYYEHMPFRSASFPTPGGMQIYRRATMGDLLDLHLLDTRQFRTDQPCGDGFKPHCAGWDDANAQILGRPEEAWLAGNLKQKSARWNAIAQQVMMMPLDRRTADEPQPLRNMDSWGGYNAPRERVLAMFEGLGNVVVLTGDEHQNFAGELRRQGGQGNAVGVEFVSTSISSGGDGADSRSGTDRILRENPFLKYTNDRRGYLVCDIDRERWQTAFRTVDYVTRAGAAVATAATATVEHGRPELHFS